MKTRAKVKEAGTFCKQVFVWREKQKLGISVNFSRKNFFYLTHGTHSITEFDNSFVF